MTLRTKVVSCPRVTVIELRRVVGNVDTESVKSTGNANVSAIRVVVE